MKTIIKNIEIELRKIFRDAGVADINTGDIYKTAPRYPAVDIMLTDREQNDFQSMRRGKVGWDLHYDISCMFAGSEANLTFENARNFVEKMCDLILAEKLTRLNNKVFDIDVLKVEYGRTTIRTDVMADGGVLKLVIQVFEAR